MLQHPSPMEWGPVRRVSSVAGPLSRFIVVVSVPCRQRGHHAKMHVKGSPRAGVVGAREPDGSIRIPGHSDVRVISWGWN